MIHSTEELCRVIVETLRKHVSEGASRELLPDDVEVLMEVLSTTAFEILLNPEYRQDSIVSQTRMQSLREKSCLRFLGSVRRLQDRNEAKWKQAQDALLGTPFEDRSIISRSDLPHIEINSQHIVDFFGGLYLAKFASEEALNDARRWSADASWYLPWRFAIEAPTISATAYPGKAYDNYVLCQALSLLFERPRTGSGLSRPNELIYHAWPLLADEGSVTSLSEGAPVIGSFLGEFRELVAGSDPVALALNRSFVRCPPTEKRMDHQPFWMGTNNDGGKIGPSEGACRLSVRLMMALRNLLSTKKKSSFRVPNAEHPRHQVIVSPFLLQKALVTRRQYRLYDSEHEQVYSEHWRDGPDVFAARAPDLDCPMLNVTWYDAWVFSRWLGGRLPTEAEWEYACRAGSNGHWCFGDDEAQVEHYAWYRSNSGETTHPVGQKVPNAWGLLDMHGNLFEWCSDWFDEYYYERFAGKIVENPTGPATPVTGHPRSKVIRGGCWENDAAWCRSAHRRVDQCDARGHSVGFRVASVLHGSGPGQCK